MKSEVGKDIGSVLEQITDLIYEILPDSECMVTEEARLFEDLGFDSVTTMQLLVAAEEKFGFDSGDSEESLQAFETVGAFAEFVEKYKSR